MYSTVRVSALAAMNSSASSIESTFSEERENIPPARVKRARRLPAHLKESIVDDYVYSEAKNSTFAIIFCSTCMYII